MIIKKHKNITLNSINNDGYPSFYVSESKGEDCSNYINEDLGRDYSCIHCWIDNIDEALERFNKFVEKEKDVPVQLTLTNEETQFLANVLSRVGGCPTTSQRKHANSIDDKLKALGYEDVYQDQFKGCIDCMIETGCEK